MESVSDTSRALQFSVACSTPRALSFIWNVLACDDCKCIKLEQMNLNVVMLMELETDANALV